MVDYRRLEVWRKAHSVVLEVYRLTSSFPASETYGLASQLRRSAVSVASNIAEGSGRLNDGDFGRFVAIAQGSASELDYQALLAKELGYVKPASHDRLAQEITSVRKMLHELRRRIKQGS